MKRKRSNHSEIKTLLLGLMIAWSITLVFLLLGAYGVHKEILPIQIKNYFGYIICALSVWISTMAVIRTSKRKGLAIGAGGSYYGSLLIMALILGNGLSIKAIILLPILFAACMLGIGMGKKRGTHRFAIK